MPHIIHTSHNPHKSIQIPPAVFPPPDPGGGSGFNFLKADFENGVFTPPFWNPWGFGISVKPDPTTRATGNVLDIAYENNPPPGGNNYDSNLAVQPGTPSVPLFTLGLGQELDFKTDLYIDGDNIVDPNTLRKLTYWGWPGTGLGFPHLFALVLTSFGPQVAISNEVQKASGEVIDDFTYIDTAVFSLTPKVWHTLKMRLVLDTAFGAANGVLSITFDNINIFNRSNMQYTSSDWLDDPNTYKWTSWGVGYQMQSNSHIAEHRYFDNISFANSEAAL